MFVRPERLNRGSRPQWPAPENARNQVLRFSEVVQGGFRDDTGAGKRADPRKKSRDSDSFRRKFPHEVSINHSSTELAVDVADSAPDYSISLTASINAKNTPSCSCCLYSG
jgi:hypothetical protein